MRTWKVAIHRDTADLVLGLHGIHTSVVGMPNVEMVGVLENNSDNAPALMEVTKAQALYHDYEIMLDEAKPDIVILCSRHPYEHFPQITAAAQRGVHILCEKSMTVDLAEADEIIALLEKQKVTLCMAHPSRYDKYYLKMKTMIEAGDIGTPLTAHGRGKCDHRGGGEDTTVLGTHVLDVMTFMFGNPESVLAEMSWEGTPVKQGDTCETVERIGPTGGDDLYALYRLPNNVRGIFESRRDTWEGSYEKASMGLAVIGTKGTLTMRFQDYSESARLMISRHPVAPDCYAEYEEIPVVDERSIPGAESFDYSLCGPHAPKAYLFLEGYRYALWDLMNAIEEKRLPLSNAYNARTTLEMINGIYFSQISGQRITFPLAQRNNPLIG